MWMWVLIIVIILCFFAFLIFTLWEVKQYNVRFRRKKLTGTKTIIEDDKARLINRKTNARWHLKKAKMNVPIAPPDAIETGENGKVYVTAYWDGFEHKYGIDRTNSETIKQKHLSEIGDYDVLTSQDKDFMATEIEESMTHGKNKFWEKYGTPIVIGGILMGFFVIFAAMIGEPLSYIQESGEAWRQTSESFEKASGRLYNASEKLNDIVGSDMTIPSKNMEGKS